MWGVESNPTGKQREGTGASRHDTMSNGRCPISPASGVAMKVMLHWHKTGKVKPGKAVNPNLLLAPWIEDLAVVLLIALFVVCGVTVTFLASGILLESVPTHGSVFADANSPLLSRVHRIWPAPSSTRIAGSLYSSTQPPGAKAATASSNTSLSKCSRQVSKKYEDG